MNMVNLLIALGFILFDIITGLIGALKNHTYQSSVMREGLFHKLGEILAIAFGYACEAGFPYVGIEVSIPICTSVMIYIIIMEVGSIVENLTIISPELKAILDKTFKGYEDKLDSGEYGKHEKH